MIFDSLFHAIDNIEPYNKAKSTKYDKQHCETHKEIGVPEFYHAVWTDNIHTCVTEG